MIFHYTFDVPSVHFTSVRRKQKKGKTEVYAWTPLKLLLKYNHHNAKMHYQNKIYNYIIHNNNNSFFFTLFMSPNTQNWITRLYHRMNRVCSFVKPSGRRVTRQNKRRLTARPVNSTKSMTNFRAINNF